MSPLFVPLVILLAVLLDRAPALIDDEARRTQLVRIGGVVLVVLVVGQGVAFTREGWTSTRDGLGYAARAWTESDIVDAARSIPEAATFYTNAPAGMWAVLRREPVYRAPSKRARRANVALPMSEEFLTAVRCDDVYLAWADGVDTSYLFSPEELQEYVDLAVVDRVDDGTLYRVTAKAGESADC
jgi:hypothetical protein